MAKCPERPEANHEAVSFGGLTFQHLMLIIACFCLALTLFISGWLVISHLRRYTRPAEQRPIVRIALVPPVFGILSCFSLAFYTSYQYLNPIQLFYEAAALVSLFLLFVEYVKKGVHEDVFFKQARPHKDLALIAPGCCFPCCRKRKGEVAAGEMLRWYRLLWILIFLYFFFMFVLTVGQIVASADDTFCEESLSFKYAHIWITIGNTIVTTAGLGALIAFYLEFKNDMKPHRPTWKLLTFKLEVIIQLFQSIVFSFLAGRRAYTPGGHVTKEDYLYGIPSFLVACEQVFFAIAFLFVFKSRYYRPGEPAQEGRETMPFWRAFLDVVSPMDLILAIGRAFTLTGQMWHKDERGVRGYHFKKASESGESSTVDGPPTTDGDGMEMPPRPVPVAATQVPSGDQGYYGGPPNEGYYNAPPGPPPRDQ